MKNTRVLLVVVVLALATGALYATRLAFAPVYLVHDEVQFGRQADSLRLTGRDLDGRDRPLYFAEPGFSIGRDPILIYATALVLHVLPLSELSVRLPTALAGVADVVLMFLLARRLFRREWLALVAAGLLALTPAHFMHSRLGVSLIVPLPFVLAWLLLLAAFLEDEKPWQLVAATCALGLGMYSYLGSIVMMPVYLAGTAVVVHGKALVRRWTMALVAFLVPLGPLVAWEFVHPRYVEIVQHYYPTGHGSAPPSPALPGLTGILNSSFLSTRVAAYWECLSPTLLFISGESSPINATRQAGVFLWPLAFLMAVGVHAIVTSRRSPFTLLLLAGFLTAPLSSAITADVGIRRALVMLPFGVLIATFGAERLLGERRLAWRAAGLGLVLLVPLSFWSFYRDYMGDYRVRSATWYGGNIRDALEAVIDREEGRAVPIYLSTRIQYVDGIWDFYLRARSRLDLLASSVYFDDERFTSAPGGSLLVSAAGAPPSAAALAAAGWSQIAASLEPDNTVSYLVFEKRRP